MKTRKNARLSMSDTRKKERYSALRAKKVEKSANAVTSNTYVGVYPMLPRGYTAEEREELRQFEKKIMSGRRYK